MTARTSVPDGTSDDPAAPETRIPDDATVHACDRCGRPFERERYLVLHRGLEHPADLSAAEREAFEDARETEEDALWRYRIVALGALVVLYFGLLYAYALV
jgi:hypothetical protein